MLLKGLGKQSYSLMCRLAHEVGGSGWAGGGGGGWFYRDYKLGPIF